MNSGCGGEDAHRESNTATRRRLRRLDACLADLEDAHERGETRLTTGMASRLRAVVPELTPGMPITLALDRVFEEQELCLPGAAGEAASGARSGTGESHTRRRPGPAIARQRSVAADVRQRADEVGEPLDRTTARELTERIKSGAEHPCVPLLEAHERRAWTTLGYRTWEGYVRREFNLSRRRSYELLSHARVLREIQAGTGFAGIPNLSTHAALQIKPHLPLVIETIRRRTAGMSEQNVARVIGEVVQEVRSAMADEQRRPAPAGR